MKPSEYMEEWFWQEPDGTWTVHIEHWQDEPIRGIPTRELAVTILDTMHEAMESYAHAYACED